MNKDELKRALKGLPTTISIVGKEEVLREEAIALLLATFVAKGTEDFNVDTVAGVPSPATRSTIAAFPVASDFRIVFLESDVPDKHVSGKPFSTVLVTTSRAFEKPQLEIDCNRLYGKRLKQWARSEAKRKGMDLDKDDIDALVQQGSGLRKLRDDLEKLSLCGRKPSKDVIAQIVYSASESTGWDIIKHVAAGDLTKAVNTLQQAKGAGVNMLQIIAALQVVFTNMFLTQKGVALDLRDYEKERLDGFILKFGQHIKACLVDILEVEVAIKSGIQGTQDVWLITRLAQRAA